MTLRATARLQLHADFPFDAARAQLDYYADLGVSHLYLSPITQARPGSMHGYDVLDPSRVSADLGGEQALERLVDAVKACGMGLLLDIVPNHMAADARNPWWRDVLRHGRASAYADYFDIDWEMHAGKILLPILGQPYGSALCKGDIQLGKQHGEPVVLAGGQALPISGPSVLAALARYTDATDHAERKAALHALLEQQCYCLAWWRSATNQLNWRRFFDINDLVGLRVEDPSVFEAAHSLPLALYRQGWIDGLRIDHVDGLAEPGAYLRRLRTAMREAAPTRTPYIVVEKILAPQEALDRRWPVAGTTGYDFMDDVSALLHAPSARRPLLACWYAHGGDSTGLKHQLHVIRAQLLERRLAHERHGLLKAWSRLASHKAEDQAAWDRVLSAWLTAFPVYRSYAEDGGPSAADRTHWDEATRSARAMLAESDSARLEELLRDLHAPAGPEGLSALKRLQQVTPPLAAKSLEDTLHYRQGTLLSRNEVGAWPQRFALGPQGFHARNHWRYRHMPHSLLATATHDHKRGEDTRARLAVLTEMPSEWAEMAAEWLALLPASSFSESDRYILLQALIGAWPADWPADIDTLDPLLIREWLTRISAWQRKALREAGLHSSWSDPDEHYEAAAQACIDVLGPGGHDRQPLRKLAALAQSLVEPGHINSLAQTLLRNTCPGVPDLYQGTELWDYSLVDPDNRRPVDYARRRFLLSSGIVTRPESKHWRNGAVKQSLIYAALQLRAQQPALFTGPYRPLCADGPRAAHVVAFLRGTGRRTALVVVPRLCARRIAGYARDEAEAARQFWRGTTLRVPSLPGLIWKDLLNQRELPLSTTGEIALDTLFQDWPVALCVSTD